MTAAAPPPETPPPEAAPPPDPSTWRLPRLRVDADGVWHHEGAEITHEGILANLRDSLRVDDQGYHLQIGAVRVPVEVDDTPYAVIRVEATGDGLAVVLSDGMREPLGLDDLALGPREIPYCRVKAGRFPARFSRAAAWTLLQHAEEGTDPAAPVLRLPGGRRHVLPRGPRPSR